MRFANLQLIDHNEFEILSSPANAFAAVCQEEGIKKFLFSLYYKPISKLYIKQTFKIGFK